MKRITVPEPQIELYKDGFDGHDLLGREGTGKKLSDLVERIDEPLVIALDGAWGSGKSHFLKCWVGEHLKRAGITTQTVYFDAFKHDYLDDPLIALTGEVAKRFTTEEAKAEAENSEQQAARVQKLKKSAWAVGKGAARIGLSVATFGATEALGDMGDEIAKAVGDEAKAFVSSAGGEEEASKFWAMHEAKTAAMESFRLALEELTEPDETGTPTRKLVIVFDELDRCRPDYALQLLEIIKHFLQRPRRAFCAGGEFDGAAKFGEGTLWNWCGCKHLFAEVPISDPETDERWAPRKYRTNYLELLPIRFADDGLPKRNT